MTGPRQGRGRAEVVHRPAQGRARPRPASSCTLPTGSAADGHQAEGALVRRLVAAPRVDRRQRSSEVDHQRQHRLGVRPALGDPRRIRAGPSARSPAGRQEAGGGQAQSGHDGARSGDAGQVSVQGPAEVGQHTGRQHLPDVAGLTRQRGRATHPAGHPRLGDALRPAAVPEVAPGRPLAGYVVVHDGRRLVQEDAVGKQLSRPDAELGLLAAELVVAVATQPGVEATDRRQDRAAQRHVAAHQVPDRRRRGRLPAIAAAHDPAELTRPPGRFRGLPGGRGRAADPEDVSGPRTGRAGACSSPPRRPRRRPGSRRCRRSRRRCRCCGRRRGPGRTAFGSTEAVGKATCARASRASLWSITTMISSTGRRCACTELTAWQSCSQRASV